MALEPKEIRRRFELLCCRLGWQTGTAIADGLGANQGDVSKWRSGDRKIPRRHLTRLAELAGESPYFFTEPETWEGAFRRREMLTAARELEVLAGRLRDEAPTLPGEDEKPGDEGSAHPDGKGKHRTG